MNLTDTVKRTRASLRAQVRRMQMRAHLHVEFMFAALHSIPKEKHRKHKPDGRGADLFTTTQTFFKSRCRTQKSRSWTRKSRCRTQKSRSWTQRLVRRRSATSPKAKSQKGLPIGRGKAPRDPQVVASSDDRAGFFPVRETESHVGHAPNPRRGQRRSNVDAEILGR